MDWKNKRRDQGYKDILVWLSPKAARALNAVKSRMPEHSVSELLSDLLVAAAGDEPYYEGGPGQPSFLDRISSLEADMAGLKERIVILEKNPVVKRAKPSRKRAG